MNFSIVAINKLKLYKIKLKKKTRKYIRFYNFPTTNKMKRQKGTDER